LNEHIAVARAEAEATAGVRTAAVDPVGSIVWCPATHEETEAVFICCDVRRGCIDWCPATFVETEAVFVCCDVTR